MELSCVSVGKNIESYTYEEVVIVKFLKVLFCLVGSVIVIWEFYHILLIRYLILPDDFQALAHFNKHYFNFRFPVPLFCIQPLAAEITINFSFLIMFSTSTD